MSDGDRTRPDDLNKLPENAVEARLRVSGSSLPGSRNGILAPPSAGSRVLRPAPIPLEKAETPTEQPPTPQERVLAERPQPVASADQPSSFQRALGAARGVAGVVQKILPLLDGNVASAVFNLLAPRNQAPGSAANLAPVESALVKLHAEQREMRSQIGEQNTSLKRVADQLEMVKEATDRNTLEQQELVDDLHSMRKRVTVFAWVGLGLLAVSIVVNVVLFLRLQHVIP